MTKTSTATKRNQKRKVDDMSEQLEDVTKELASVKMELDRMKKEEEARLIAIAARIHFALVHDLVRDPPIGSTTGIHVSHAWDKIPEYIRVKFPRIEEHAALIKNKNVSYSVPIDPTLKEAIRRGP